MGFRKEQINANLLNGKGEITNVSLNCQVLNEQHVRKVTSLLEIQDVHLSRLGFHVTSWANLRKAPIVVDIGKVTVVLKEPLELLPKAQRKRLKILRERELVELLLNGTFQPFRGSGSYGFSDRIVDNLTIEMESLQIQWQAWGKFKTQRPGPWRPPLLQIDMEHLKVVAVDEYGHEAPPEQVWAHNRFGQKEFMLYKKIMGEVHVKLVDQNGGVEVNLIRHLHFENQMVVKRRLRDGAILGIQTDLTIPKLDMEIQAHDIPILAHWLVASQYCLGKEKSFEDPLKEANDDDDGGEEVSPSPTEAGPAWLAASEGGEDGEDSDDDENDDLNEGNATYDDAGSIASNDRDTSFMADDQSQATQTSRTGSIDAPYKERPIILLPNGIVIYDAVCFTCSIHDATIRGVYATGRNGYVQVSSKGCITEFMWPKAESEPGIYLQASASFVSIQERLDQSVRTIVIGGITQGDHLSIHKPRKAAAQVKADENFPMFERRSLRDDPLELRHTFPSQAFGIKTTIDVLMPDDSDKGDSSLPPMSLLEIGTNEFDIVLDADAWCRSFSFLLNEQGGGFDPRWTTGDWTEVLSPDMLKDPSAPLQLDEHLQIAKQVFLDDNFMLSSDRFNITARFSNFELRVPAAVKENIRSCDILIQLQETTIVMSSALPRTFLNGKIGNSISGDGNDSEVAVDFPNDPSDVAYSLISSEDPSLRLSGAALSRSVSTCRAQITLRGFQVQTIPIIPYCNAPQTQQLISPMEMTSIICFEGEPPPPESNLTKIALFYSVHVYDLTVNFDFDLLAGATSSVIYHSGVATTAICRWINLFSAQSNMHLSVAESQSYADDVEDDPINKTLKGRRIMVKRQFARSRETGGLSVVFCMQLSKLHYTMWRQNVPYYSPFRPPPNKDSTHESSVIELLKLVDLCATEFEFGLEFEFHVPSGRRTVLKCCVDEGHLLVCDVSKVMQSLTGVSNDMVKLIAFGKDKLPSQLHQAYPGTQQHVAIRLEEQLKESTRSWSLSSDLNCQAIIDTSHNEVKDVVILVLEELLLPTWSKRELPFSEDAPFPAKTIGALFYHLFVLLMQIIPKSTGDVLKVPMPPETTEENVISTIERVLKSLCARFLPKDLSLILFRIEIANLLLSIPDSTTQRLGLHLMQADVVTRLVPNRSMRDIEMEHMLACKGIPWSTLIKSKSDRFYQSVMSRQSLLVLKSEDLELEIEELVHPFKVGLTYAASRIHLEMSEDLRITDIRRLELFSDGLIALRDQCLQNVATLSSYLQIMMQRKQQSRSLTNGHAAFSQDDSDDLAVKEQLDNTSTTTAIRPSFGKVQRALQLAQSELSDYEQKVAEDRLQTKARVEELEKKVFTKERDRFAAIALTTSRIAGWMRTGNIQATGQRVGRMATLWPFWVVLRKNLLLVYPSPGEVSFSMPSYVRVRDKN